MMEESAARSFFKFLLGFFAFIGLSFGVTIAASTLGNKEGQAQAAAAAEATMIQR